MVQGARGIKSGLAGHKTLLSNLIQIIKLIQKLRPLLRPLLPCIEPPARSPGSIQRIRKLYSKNLKASSQDQPEPWRKRFHQDSTKGRKIEKELLTVS